MFYTSFIFAPSPTRRHTADRIADAKIVIIIILFNIYFEFQQKRSTFALHFKLNTINHKQ